MHMVQHLLIADLARAAAAAGDALAGAAVPAPARGAACGWPGGAACGGVPGRCAKPLVAVPVYVAVLYLWHFDFAFEAAVQRPARPRPPARVLRRDRDARLVVGDRAQAPPRPRRAVEGPAPARRAPGRHVPRHGLRPHPRRPIYTDVYGAAASAPSASPPSPTSRSPATDADHRRRDHRVRRVLDRVFYDAADATGDGRRTTRPVNRRATDVHDRPCPRAAGDPTSQGGVHAVTGSDRRRAAPSSRAYLTVSLPSMPPSRWPGTEQ